VGRCKQAAGGCCRAPVKRLFSWPKSSALREWLSSGAVPRGTSKYTGLSVAHTRNYDHATHAPPFLACAMRSRPSFKTPGLCRRLTRAMARYTSSIFGVRPMIVFRRIIDGSVGLGPRARLLACTFRTRVRRSSMSKGYGDTRWLRTQKLGDSLKRWCGAVMITQAHCAATL